jgi:hypothetical protein
MMEPFRDVLKAVRQGAGKGQVLVANFSSEQWCFAGRSGRRRAMKQDELSAFNALAKHARLGDLVTLTREVSAAAVEARGADWRNAAKVKARAEELKLTSADAATDYGNALEVLERGPEDDAERTLVASLAAHAIAESPPKDQADEDRVAGDALWLATHTPFDATRLFDRALGEASTELWAAVADRVRRIDQGKMPTLGRGEALMGCAALLLSSSTAAQKHVAALASEVRDPALLRVLSSRPRPADECIQGEIAPCPRSLLATTLLAVTGLLFFIHAVRILARLAFAYRHPAEVTLSGDGVRIRARKEMLGRTLGDREVVIGRAALARAIREVRYPRVAFYAGLFALVTGTTVGVMTFVDGVRAASPSLLVTGLVLVAAGIAMDFALGSASLGSRGRCRVVFVPRRGRAVCVGGVDLERAESALSRLTAGAT